MVTQVDIAANHTVNPAKVAQIATHKKRNHTKHKTLQYEITCLTQLWLHSSRITGFTLKFKFKVNCTFGKLHYQVILVYNKQLQVKSIGRAVSSLPSRTRESVQYAQKAKLSRLRHLLQCPGGGLRGSLHSST